MSVQTESETEDRENPAVAAVRTWSGITHSKGLTLQQVSERAHITRDEARLALDLAMAGRQLVQDREGVYRLPAEDGAPAAETGKSPRARRSRAAVVPPEVPTAPPSPRRPFMSQEDRAAAEASALRTGPLFVASVPIGAIRVVGNVRTRFDEDALRELAASIREIGIQTPLVLRPARDAGDAYDLIAGERRLRAAGIAGLTAVPAMVHFGMTDEQAALVQLVENLQRADLDPIDEAEGIAALVRTHRWTQSRVAQQLGRSQPWVANRLRLLRLPEEVRTLISDGILPARTAEALLRIPEGRPDLVQAAANFLVVNRIPQADAAHKVDGVLIGACPVVGAEESYRLRTLDADAHAQCPCRHVCELRDSVGRAHQTAVCVDPIRFEQVEAETVERLDRESVAEEEARQAEIEAAAAAATATAPEDLPESAPAPKKKRAEQATAGLIDLSKGHWQEYGPGRNYARLENCKDSHASCPCRRKALSYSRVISICIDPKAHHKIELAASRDQNKALRQKIEAQNGEAAAWVEARLGEQWPALDEAPTMTHAELALWAALTICHVAPDYSGPSQRPRANLVEYLKRFGLEFGGGGHGPGGLPDRYQHGAMAQALLGVDARTLWRICLEWPLLAQDPASERAIGHWYRRAAGGDVLPEPAEAEASAE